MAIQKFIQAGRAAILLSVLATGCQQEQAAADATAWQAEAEIGQADGALDIPDADRDTPYEYYWDMDDRLCSLLVGRGTPEDVIAKFQDDSGWRVSGYRQFADGLIVALRDGRERVLWHKQIDCKDPPYDPLLPSDPPPSIAQTDTSQSNPSRPSEASLPAAEQPPGAAQNETAKYWFGFADGESCRPSEAGSIYTSPFIFVRHGKASLAETSPSGDVVVLETKRVDNVSVSYMIFADRQEKCEETRTRYAT